MTTLSASTTPETPHSAINSMPSQHIPQRKKKATRACIHCQKAHLTCDDSRPCQRCIKRDLASTCADGARKKAKYLQDAEVHPIVTNVRATQPNPVAPATTTTSTTTPSITSTQLHHQHHHHQHNHQHQQHGSPDFTLPDTRPPLQTPSLPTTPSSFTSGNQSIMDDILFPPRSIGSIPSAVLNSSHISSSGISSMLPYGDGAVVAKIASPVTAGAAVKRRNQIITPEMAYASATKPFSYAEGYHYLITYVRQKMSREDLMRISRALALFRPSVLASMMNLTEDDLIFTEKCLQRTLLEYEKLISYSGTPTVVWRRTGEIALVGKEFSLLTQWSRDALLNKKTYIYELMSDASAVEYWEKYALHAFDNTDSAVYSSCILISPTKRLVPCTFCFTIKRDIFDLPSVIVGNFLPILS
ncbi:hypothetical protein J3Q64DRAFT_1656887 [Phycomyces blakesleeanus]|uniref:Zn(2)-C6 fungal-type domain-containing protein n=1 Tax=Phycomyces blakesleeanus TaxID=4837 RepID=A0ABR3B7E2_PHYBL